MKDIRKVKGTPTVSIVMGIYNCQDTLAASIESILNQSYENWELIMCDDASTDKTLEIAREYAEEYPYKIKLLQNEKNLTLAPTLNKCLKEAKGKYIARQDGDDISLPQRLKLQVEFLEGNREYKLVGTNMISFDEEREYGLRRDPEKPEAKSLMRGSPFNHATIMICSETLRSLGGYSEKPSVKQVEDLELWFRFFAAGCKGYNLQTPLYRVREDRSSYKRKNLNRRINEAVVILKGRKMLGLPAYYSVAALKPIVAWLTPKRLLTIYHRARMKAEIQY